MIVAPSLKDVAEAMGAFLNKHGDMPIMFHDERGNFHNIVGQSLGTAIDTDEKMFVLRAYDLDNKPKGVQIGSAKNK